MYDHWSGRYLESRAGRWKVEETNRIRIDRLLCRPRLPRTFPGAVMHLYKSGSTADHHKALQCFDVRKAFLGGFAFDSRLSVCGAGPWRSHPGPSTVLHTRSPDPVYLLSCQHWHHRDHSTTMKQAWENLSLAIIVYLSPVSLGPRYVPVTRPVPPAEDCLLCELNEPKAIKIPSVPFRRSIRFPPHPPSSFLLILLPFLPSSSITTDTADSLGHLRLGLSQIYLT